MHCIFQTSASTLAAPPSGNEGETAEDEPHSQQDDVSDEQNDDEKVNNTEDDNESNYEGSVSENAEADISQIPTDSIDQVADYTDDQDSTFNPKPSDLKSLDGSEVTTDEEIQQEDIINPTDESDVSNDFEGVIFTSVATDISKKSGSSSNTKNKRTNVQKHLQQQHYQIRMKTVSYVWLEMPSMLKPYPNSRYHFEV